MPKISQKPLNFYRTDSRTAQIFKPIIGRSWKTGKLPTYIKKQYRKPRKMEVTFSPEPSKILRPYVAPRNRRIY